MHRFNDEQQKQTRMSAESDWKFHEQTNLEEKKQQQQIVQIFLDHFRCTIDAGEKK